MGLSWGLLQLETCETVRHCHPCAIVAQASWVGGCWRRKVVASFFLVGEGHEMSACFLGLISFSHFSHVTFGEIPSFDSITICLMFLEKSWGFLRNSHVCLCLGQKPFLSSSARWIWIPAFRCSNPKVLSFLALNPSTQRQKSRVKVLNNVNPGSLTLGIPWLTKWWLTLIKWRNLRGTIQVWSLLRPKVVLDALGKLFFLETISLHVYTYIIYNYI